MDEQKEPFEEKDFECWVINENAQYRIQNQKQDNEIEFSFWIPNGKVEKFKTTYRNLINILKYSSENLAVTKY